MRTFIGVLIVALLLPHTDGWLRLPVLCVFMVGVASLLREVGRE